MRRESLSKTSATEALLNLIHTSREGILLIEFHFPDMRRKLREYTEQYDKISHCLDSYSGGPQFESLQGFQEAQLIFYAVL
jgi:hypothetical protein